MTEMSCSQVEESTTEFALGILPAEEARAVSAHVLACPACRREVEEIRHFGDRLLDLVPDAEPPLGFDRRVLSSVGATRRWRPSRTRLVLCAAAAAAVLAGVGTAAAELAAGHSSAPTGQLAGVFHEGGRTVGTVYLGGHPAWVSMTVDHLSVTGTVSCQLVTSSGQVTSVGSFQLVDGSGSWGAPEGATNMHFAEARLVAPSGAVLARAPLTPS